MCATAPLLLLDSHQPGDTAPLRGLTLWPSIWQETAKTEEKPDTKSFKPFRNRLAVSPLGHG